MLEQVFDWFQDLMYNHQVIQVIQGEFVHHCHLWGILIDSILGLDSSALLLLLLLCSNGNIHSFLQWLTQ
jgi:hypothetical protein